MGTTDQASGPDTDDAVESSGRVDLRTLAMLAEPGLLQPPPDVALASDDDQAPLLADPQASEPAPARPTVGLLATTVLCGFALLAVGGAAGHAVALGWTARPLALANAEPGSIALAAPAAIGSEGGAGIATPARETAPRATAAGAPALLEVPSAELAVALADRGEALPEPATTATVEPGRHTASRASRRDPAVRDAPLLSRSAPGGSPTPPAWPEESGTAPVHPARPSDRGTVERSEVRTFEELIERAGGPTPRGSRAERPTASTLPETPSSHDARAALDALAPALRACAAGAHAEARLLLMVAGETGRVRSATVTGDFAGTPAGSCMARAARSVRLPAFSRATFSIAYPISL